jgi:DNA-directed RNA polymerase subunit K/omega
MESEVFSRGQANQSVVDEQDDAPTQQAERTTRNICSRFEMTQIISLRGLQLALNDPPLVDPMGSTDCLEIALRELKQGKLGKLIVRRYFPDGSQEDWRVEELQQIHK